MRLTIGMAAGILVLAMLSIWWFQRCLIYFPGGPAPSVASALPGGEDVAFTTGDGVRLAGWFLPPARQPNAGTVIVFNGNAGNRADRVPLATALAREGLSVLLFDYRGFGGNRGSPSEAGLFADARAARTYVLSRPDVDPARLLYYGESLGTAVATGLAAEQPPAALVLRSPFPALTDVGRRHYPFLPVDLLLMDRYPAAEWIGRVPSPVLVVAGDADGLIPVEMSQRVYHAAPGPKEFVLVPGADHGDPRLGLGPEALDGLRRLLLHLPARTR